MYLISNRLGLVPGDGAYTRTWWNNTQLASIKNCWSSTTSPTRLCTSMPGDRSTIVSTRGFQIHVLLMSSEDPILLLTQPCSHPFAIYSRRHLYALRLAAYFGLLHRFLSVPIFQHCIQWLSISVYCISSICIFRINARIFLVRTCIIMC